MAECLMRRRSARMRIAVWSFRAVAGQHPGSHRRGGTELNDDMGSPVSVSTRVGRRPIAQYAAVEHAYAIESVPGRCPESCCPPLLRSDPVFRLGSDIREGNVLDIRFPVTGSRSNVNGFRLAPPVPVIRNVSIVMLENSTWAACSSRR
jgi:hypothetical protein